MTVIRKILKVLTRPLPSGRPTGMYGPRHNPTVQVEPNQMKDCLAEINANRV